MIFCARKIGNDAVTSSTPQLKAAYFGCNGFEKSESLQTNAAMRTTNSSPRGETAEAGRAP